MQDLTCHGNAMETGGHWAGSGCGSHDDAGGGSDGCGFGDGLSDIGDGEGDDSNAYGGGGGL